MNKLTAIRIKYDDGTYSDEIPVSTLAEYIFWDDSHNLVDILGNIDMSKGTVQAQLNEKIDDNELDQYLNDEISTDVTNWLNTHVTPVGSAVIVDSSLTIEGAAADAAATGAALAANYTELTEEVEQLNERIDDIEPGLSEDAKTALLACFQHIVFLDDDDDYYTNLRDALYASDELVSLSAVFNQGSTIIYPDEPLDNLRTMLVVTGLYADDNTKVINDYRLSGTLVGDTLSVITVSYRDKTTTFAVAVTDYEWGSDYTWLYRADTDGLLSENENVSVKTAIGGVSGTETLIDGVLNLSASYTTSGGGDVFKLIPLTCTNAVLKAKVKFKALPISYAPSGLRLQLSNGTKGAQMFAYKNANDMDYRIGSQNEDTQQKLADIQLNRWYVLSCEIKSDDTQVLKIDDATYNINALSSYANTQSRVIVQNPGGQTDSGNIDVDIAWISFKNNA